MITVEFKHQHVSLYLKCKAKSKNIFLKNQSIFSPHSMECLCSCSAVVVPVLIVV